MWDATCTDTLAPSHRALAAREPRAVAADAEQRKRVKYAHLDHTHHFVPVAVETLGAMGAEALVFFKEVARRKGYQRAQVVPIPSAASGCSHSERKHRLGSWGSQP